MNHDIDAALEGWEYKLGMVQARLVQAQDGRQVIQMRVDLGILQIETTDRPDGTRPHGCPTYMHYLQRQKRMVETDNQSFVLSDEQCQEADREFMQYYYRRLCWLALRNYDRAIKDADHTLAFMDFVRDHSPDEEFTRDHEQYRGFVLYQRTQASAARALEEEKPESAIDEIAVGLKRIEDFFTENEAEEQLEENGMVQQLRKLEKSLREKHGIDVTLQEQLDLAVAEEDYEKAARLRDKLRTRGE
ncbi:MAG: UvrB/UvrC motif-containing protein [Gemmataceae bacterium]